MQSRCGAQISMPCRTDEEPEKIAKKMCAFEANDGIERMDESITLQVNNENISTAAISSTEPYLLMAVTNLSGSNRCIVYRAIRVFVSPPPEANEL